MAKIIRSSTQLSSTKKDSRILDTKKSNLVKDLKEKTLSSKDTKAKVESPKKVVKAESKKETKAKAEAPKIAKKEVKAESKDKIVAKKEVKVAAKKADPIQSKFNAAFDAVKVSTQKVKIGETGITVFTTDRLSPKQFSKLKSIAGKKLDLSTRGESWVMSYQ